eukprot:scaffold18793_cov129-Isochrysis_galbana.AAC.3
MRIRVATRLAPCVLAPRAEGFQTEGAVWHPLAPDEVVWHTLVHAICVAPPLGPPAADMANASSSTMRRIRPITT